MSKSVIERINRNILEHKQTINKPLEKCKYDMGPIDELHHNSLERPKKLERFKSRDRARTVKYNRSSRMINDNDENNDENNEPVQINNEIVQINNEIVQNNIDMRKPILKIRIPKEKTVPIEQPIPILIEQPIENVIRKRKPKKDKRVHTRLMRELIQVSSECNRILNNTKNEIDELLKLVSETAKQNREDELNKNRGFFSYLMSYFY
jgi:hypothetical protein